MLPKAGKLKKHVFYVCFLRLGGSKRVCFASVAESWDAQKACVLRLLSKAGRLKKHVFYKCCLRPGCSKSVCFTSVLGFHNEQLTVGFVATCSKSMYFASVA